MCQTWSSNEVLRSSTPSMFVSGLPRSMIIRCFHVSRVRNKNANIHELFWGAKNTQLCAQYTVASRYRLHGSESIPVQQCNCRLWHYLKICTIFESKLIPTSCDANTKHLIGTCSLPVRKAPWKIIAARVNHFQKPNDDTTRCMLHSIPTRPS